MWVAPEVHCTPVDAFLQYVAVRGTELGCLFRFADGMLLTKPKFVAQVRQALQSIGLPWDSFAGHSFRIGAAAAQAGIEDQQSKCWQMGRWSSAAFLSYIRTPTERLAQYSA